MPVQYNVIERGEPGVEGGGNRKFYASALSKESFDIDELTEQLQLISTISGADIRAVLYGLVDVVPKLLGQGHIVNIGDLGSFRVSISSKPSDSAEEVTVNNIKKGRILFRPGKKFKDMLNSLKFQKYVPKTTAG